MTERHVSLGGIDLAIAEAGADRVPGKPRALKGNPWLVHSKKIQLGLVALEGFGELLAR